MAFGDWIKGAFAQINPFDGGKDFRTYNPRKEEEEEEKNRNTFGSGSSISQLSNGTPTLWQDQQQKRKLELKPQRPENLFEDLNRSLELPSAQNKKSGGSKNTLAPNNKRELPLNYNKSEADKIPGFRVMSPEAQRKAVNELRSHKKAKNAQKSFNKNRKESEEKAKFWGGLPVIGTMRNWGAGLAMKAGEATGNENLRKYAENRYNLGSIGMSTDELNQYDERTQGKLKALRTGVTGLGALDVFGVGSLAKAPILAGGKRAVKEGIKTQAGRQILKDSLRQTGRQYRNNVIGGVAVGGVADPAIQAYIKDGEVDWTSVPGSMLQGGLWAAAIPEFHGKANIVQKLRSGKKLTNDESQLLNQGLRDAEQATGGTQIEVQQPREIGVTESSRPPVNIPVSNNTQPSTTRPIVEVGGDTPGVNQVRVPTAAERAAGQPQARPDKRIEGVTPYDTSNTTQNFSLKELQQEYLELEGARADGRITKKQYEAAREELDSIKPIDGDNPMVKKPKGAKIDVKETRGIPIVDETVVPTELPETPGSVRATAATAPNNAKSADVAARQPVALPVETQRVLDNPKQFNKRQVAAARNQRKLAKQMAKTQEQTAEALSRIDTATGASRTNPTAENFVSTGVSRTGRRGDAYEAVNRNAEMDFGRKEMTIQSVEDLVDELAGRKNIEAGDQRRIEAAMENMSHSNPEGYRSDPLWQVLNNRNISNRRKVAQILSMGPRTIRKSATSRALSDRWYNKVARATDSSQISDKDIARVQKANDEFTVARDDAARLAEQYKATRSTEDLKAFEKAQKAADKADIRAKTIEVDAAKNTLGGKVGDDGARLLSDLEKEAELNMMDAVTASQLSGPATGMRNFYGTELAGIENRLFANTRAGITNKLFGENVGGYSREGARMGRKEGAERMVGDAKRRGQYSGRNPLKQARNFATTVNSLGESSLYSQKRSRLTKYYENQLKEQGVTGEQLKNDTKFLSLTDPDNMSQQFMDSVMKSSGLTGIYQKSKQIEFALAQNIADNLSGVMPPGAANAIAKGVTRIALGYPTATGNFIIQSGRRATFGIPSAFESGYKLARGDKQGGALALDKAMKEAQGGAAGTLVGIALSGADLISGFYPEDPEEREEWKREGKSELSIKINGAWYPIPQGFGMMGLPLIVGSILESEGSQGVADFLTDREKVFKLLPPDQLHGVMNVASGSATDNQGKGFVASTIRSLIPAGSFLNQTAKGLDETANDTTTKDFWSNVMDQVLSGIPGQNAMFDIPDKVSDAGTPIKNPNLAQVYSGATSIEQGEGVEQTNQLNEQTNATLQGMSEYGALNDPNFKAVIEGSDAKEIYDKVAAGEQISPGEVEDLQTAMVKGVSLEGTDTAYLEREQYDTNLAALNMKRDLAAADPTVKPSSLEKLDTAIKRGEVYKENQIPYKVISDYQDTSLTEWRNMGDPDSDEYNPDMYEMLWQMDQLMTEAGVSDNYKGNMKDNKYSLKKSGSGRGRGGSRGRNLGSDFGRLKPTRGAPEIQQYETINQQSGGIPVIQVERPNIVHKIGFSG